MQLSGSPDFWDSLHVTLVLALETLLNAGRQANVAPRKQRRWPREKRACVAPPSLARCPGGAREEMSGCLLPASSQMFCGFAV